MQYGIFLFIGFLFRLQKGLRGKGWIKATLLFNPIYTIYKSG